MLVLTWWQMISSFADTQYGRCCWRTVHSGRKPKYFNQGCCLWTWLIPQSSLYNTTITLWFTVELLRVCTYYTALVYVYTHICVYVIVCIYPYIHIFLYVIFSIPATFKGRSPVVTWPFQRGTSVNMHAFQPEESEWGVRVAMCLTVVSHRRSAGCCSPWSAVCKHLDPTDGNIVPSSPEQVTWCSASEVRATSTSPPK